VAPLTTQQPASAPLRVSSVQHAPDISVVFGLRTQTPCRSRRTGCPSARRGRNLPEQVGRRGVEGMDWTIDERLGDFERPALSTAWFWRQERDAWHGVPVVHEEGARHPERVSYVRLFGRVDHEPTQEVVDCLQYGFTVGAGVLWNSGEKAATQRSSRVRGVCRVRRLDPAYVTRLFQKPRKGPGEELPAMSSHGLGTVPHL
jgi:hypothetical protein